MSLSIQQIVDYVKHTFPGVQDDYNWGERALFFNPGHKLPKGIYFLTFKEKDGANDKASKIGPGEYRLNVGISKRAYIERFGSIPSRPAAGATVATGHDFSISDIVMPHPVYGWMAWIAVKNPSHETLSEIEPLLAEAYQLAVFKFAKRTKVAAHGA